MSAYLNNIIKISEDNYSTLESNGSLEKNGLTYSYDPNSIYLVEHDYTSDTASGLTTPINVTISNGIDSVTNYGINWKSNTTLTIPSYPTSLLANGGNADTVDNYHVGSNSGSNYNWGYIPAVRSDGVIEIGKYIDFHNASNDVSDYSCRLLIKGNNSNTINLPTSSGTLALSGEALPANGGTATNLSGGYISVRANSYYTASGYGINMNNSDIIGCNSILFGDLSNDWSEGLCFYRTNGNFDSFWAQDGVPYFSINNGTSNYNLIYGTLGETDSGTTRYLKRDSNGNLYIEQRNDIQTLPTGNKTYLTYIGAKSSSNNNKSNSATTNGNTYMKIFENSTLKNQYKITGSGNVSVVSDANGNLTITGSSPTSVSYAESAGAVAWGNITSKPSSFTPSSHNHGLSHSDFYIFLNSTTTNNGWNMLDSGMSKTAPHSFALLKAIRTLENAPDWLLGNYSAGIAFGGADTKGVISVAYDSPSIKFAGGNSTEPVWLIGITGTTGTTYALNTISSNASNGNTAYGWGNHSGLYLPLTGGTISGNLSIKKETESGKTRDDTYVRDISIYGKNAHLQIIAHTDANYIESGNLDFSASADLYITGKYAERMDNLHLIATTIKSYGSITPSQTNSYNLGTTSYRWLYVYSYYSYSTNGFYQSSDIRLKNVLNYLDIQKSYDFLESCRPFNYELKSTPGEILLGVSALEVELFYPEIVSVDEEGFKSVQYDKLAVILLEVCKDMNKRLKVLENGNRN